MYNTKMQAALDEIERLYETVHESKKRTGKLPNAESDAGRALVQLQEFCAELRKLNLQQLGVTV
jgi:hypothetical protein